MMPGLAPGAASSGPLRDCTFSSSCLAVREFRSPAPPEAAFPGPPPLCREDEELLLRDGSLRAGPREEERGDWER